VHRSKIDRRMAELGLSARNPMSELTLLIPTADTGVPACRPPGQVKDHSECVNRAFMRRPRFALSRNRRKTRQPGMN
jgi:hypothetical protein